MLFTSSVDVSESTRPGKRGGHARATHAGGSALHEDKGSLANLLTWEISQMEIFVATLSRQMQLGVAEQCALVVEYFRSRTADFSSEFIQTPYTVNPDLHPGPVTT